MSRRSGRTRRKRAEGAASVPRSRGPRSRRHWIDELGIGLLTLSAVALPLAFDPASLLPFPVIKAGILGVAAYALGAAVALKVVIAGVGALPRTRLFLPVIAFLGAMAIASVLAVHTGVALWGSYDRRLGLVAAVELAIVFAAAVTFAPDRGAAAVVLVGVCAGGVLAFAYALTQRLGLDPIRWTTGGSDGVFSTFGNSNIMGLYFAVLAAGTLAYVLRTASQHEGKTRTVAIGILCVVFSTGAVLSGTRAALLGFGVGAATAVALTALLLPRGRAHPSLALAAAAGAVALAVTVVVFTPIGTRIASLAAGTDLSLVERSLLYRTILQIVADRPVFGVGPDNLVAVYNVYRPVEALFFGTRVTQSSAHGWPWRAMLDAGVIGLIASVSIMASLALGAVAALRRPDQDWRPAVLLVALVTYSAAGFFAVNDLATDWLFWLIAGLLVAAIIPSTFPPVHRLAGWRAGVAVVLAAGILWPIFGLTGEVGASRAMAASRVAAKRDTAGALTQAQRAVDNDGRWPDHWNNLGLRALDLNDRALALSAFTRAAELGPFDPLIWMNLGTLQAQLAGTQPGLRERARQSAERAVRADPKNPVVRAGAAQIYIVLGDGDAAVREVSAAQELALVRTDYDELAATALLVARRPEEALTIIQGALKRGNSAQRSFLLARVYVQQGDFAAARAALLLARDIEPNNQQVLDLLQQIAGR